jgi:hypothetical protein
MKTSVKFHPGILITPDFYCSISEPCWPYNLDDLPKQTFAIN